MWAARLFTWPRINPSLSQYHNGHHNNRCLVAMRCVRSVRAVLLSRGSFKGSALTLSSSRSSVVSAPRPNIINKNVCLSSHPCACSCVFQNTLYVHMRSVPISFLLSIRWLDSLMRFANKHLTHTAQSACRRQSMC